MRRSIGAGDNIVGNGDRTGVKAAKISARDVAQIASADNGPFASRCRGVSRSLPREQLSRSSQRCGHPPTVRRKQRSALTYDAVALDGQSVAFGDQIVVGSHETVALGADISSGTGKTSALGGDRLVGTGEAILLGGEGLICMDEFIVLDRECLVGVDEAIALGGECLVGTADAVALGGERLVDGEEAIALGGQVANLKGPMLRKRGKPCAVLPEAFCLGGLYAELDARLRNREIVVGRGLAKQFAAVVELNSQQVQPIV